MLTQKFLNRRICHLVRQVSLQKAAMSQKIKIAERFENQPPSVWVTINQVIAKHQPVNLGQGFPDFAAPPHVVTALKEVANSDNYLFHQYTRAFGHPRLVQALSDLYSPLHGRKIDPMTEILVSVGAYSSLFTIVNAFVNPGDEVLIVEPFFDCYAPMVRSCNGTPVFVPLKPSSQSSNSTKQLTSKDWVIDPEELKQKMNSKTKLLMINSPNNPMGKMYSMEELQLFADLCIKHDVVCLSDEVYEWITLDNNKHIKIATLPGMWERTLTVGSAGKTFSITGWKLGWTIGPQSLMQCLNVVHQNLVYTLPTPLQEAMARAIEHELPLMGTPESYFVQLSAELQVKRDQLAAELNDVGMTTTIPEGGYFMLADISDFDVPKEYESKDNAHLAKDVKFNYWMAAHKKLSAIPPSVFYCESHRHLGENYIRFCFIKTDEALSKAASILKEWKKDLSS